MPELFSSPLAVIAVVVFVIAYVLIASKKVNRVAAALGGAAGALAVGVVESGHAFFPEDTASTGT